MRIVLPDEGWWEWVGRQGFDRDVVSYIRSAVNKSWGLCTDPGFDPANPVWCLLRPEVWKKLDGWSVTFRGETRVFVRRERPSYCWLFKPVPCLALVAPPDS